MSLKVPDVCAWNLAQLCETQPLLTPIEGAQGADLPQPSGYFFELNALLLQCVGASCTVSDEISAAYFTHSGDTNQSLGT